MSAVDIAVARLKVEEGFRALPYIDTLGNETIGYGFAFRKGITPAAAVALLSAQTQEAASALSIYSWFQGLDDVRASVLLDLAINNGIEGLLNYHKMLAALSAKDWSAASAELLDSDAARMLPNRYNPLAALLLNGQ